ncbi:MULTISPECIES: vWA domain-containing protein [unclassified Okeania]|uniref:vWA domain-containing protein n=3 Tax=Microcoleaceae TaxID=1892252 RepID=UPI0013BC569D|nr:MULTISPECIES: vWA domain-containing protein [unclassified Okeania]NES78928.1 VWA domain-containing protein [Okeania sp. SIO1H4]NET15079.1 VWA domain-containing protein [Okeania sp. SIO1H6]NET22496.1 VWA domain-containing protein [Okeania sp. SIO1H5]NET96200.1 VWA domain-containing protein [Okeania sp. SIO1H2]
MTNNIEVVFSFDTTGSMYPCLTQVRRKIQNTVTRLMLEIPGIRIGIIAHGDYCDRHSTYVTKRLELSQNIDAICNFVERVGKTGGGDAPECYELVLHQAQSFAWTRKATKSLVLIGDDIPHPPSQNPQKLNWREEVNKLSDMGIIIYGVQALNRRHATMFYQELAEKSGGFHIKLDQFAYINDLFLAVCYQQSSDEELQNYEQEIVDMGRMNRVLNQIFNTMLNREETSVYESAYLRVVTPGRFQVLEVDENKPIKNFVLENGLTFNKGRGFYEFTKTETIQRKKEIILMVRATGDLFQGEAAREILDLPHGTTVRIKPNNLEKYVVFVQSTSVNRKLIGGTRFLYEVEDWSR